MACRNVSRLLAITFLLAWKHIFANPLYFNTFGDPALDTLRAAAVDSPVLMPMPATLMCVRLR